MSDKIQYFPTPVVLSAVHGKLLCSIDDIYRVMNFLSGDNLYTHQLPRASRILSPWVLEQHPQLKDWDDSQVSPENWQEYAKRANEKFGETLPLTPLPRERWTHIDAMEEAQAMVGDKNVIALEHED